MQEKSLGHLSLWPCASALTANSNCLAILVTSDLKHKQRTRRRFVEHFRRQPDETWNRQESNGLGGSVVISSISCTLKLADIDDRIAFAEEPSETT